MTSEQLVTLAHETQIEELASQPRLFVDSDAVVFAADLVQNFVVQTPQSLQLQVTEQCLP